MYETLESKINETWKGIGRIGKIHFVFNNYDMAMRGYWFEPIALYNGYKDEFIVISDFYNINQPNSVKKAIATLFSVFGNSLKTINEENEDFKKIYRNINLITQTKELNLEESKEIIRVHSRYIKNYLTENLFKEG